MGWYESVILPRLLDLACGTRVVERQRRAVVPAASGDILEIGVGSGHNLAHYDRGKVRSLTAIEPSPKLRAMTERRVRELALAVELLDAGAEEIPLPNQAFDTVVLTYTLCTIPQVDAALREIRRVLRPDGRLLFCEHGAAPDAGVRRWQQRLDPLWQRLAGGCHLSRDTPQLLVEHGFELRQLEAGYLPGLRILTFNTWGTAVPAAR